MKEARNDDRPLEQKAEESFSILMLVLEILSMGVLPVVNYEWGVMGTSWAGLWCAMLIPMYASYMRDPVMLEYWYVWLVFVIWRRLAASRQEDRYFQGYPHLFFTLTGNNIWKARVFQCVALFLAGQLLMGVSRGLGCWVGYLCTPALAVKWYIAHAMHRQEVIALADALKQQRFMERQMQEAEEWNERR